MKHAREQASHKELLVNVAWAAALAVALAFMYVASYPLAARCTVQPDIVVYRPVQYLIDKTPLRSQLLWWAERCGTETEIAVRSAAFRRRFAELQIRNISEVNFNDEWGLIEVR